MADNTPSSAVDICNLALTELKTDPIESLQQANNSVAELCNRHYDLERKSLIRSHTWNFAKAEESLSRASSATSVSFDDVYPLTKTFVRLRSIGDVFVGTKKTFYDIRSIKIDGVFQRCIVINNGGIATLDIMYTRNVTEVSEFDPLFTKLFKFKLAMAIAPGITMKPSTRASIKDGLADAMLEAKSIYGQERPPVKIQNSRFLNARKFATRRPYLNTVFSTD